MIEELGRARGTSGEVVLRRRVDDDGTTAVELVVDGVFAMDDAEVSTERALATEALRRCAGGALDVLVGGLGLGWTAATALADPRVAAVEVVELEPALVAWAQDGLLPGLPAPGPGRPRLHVADVLDRLAETPHRWDAVLLDVDNGPGFLVHESNAALYRPGGLATALAALRPGGVLAVWAGDPSPELVDRLAAVPGATGAAQLLLPVERDGRRYEHAVVTARRAAGGQDPAGGT